jgi:hypothetical protein
MGACVSVPLPDAGREYPPEEDRRRLLTEDIDFFSVENCLDDSKFDMARNIPRVLTTPWTLSNTTWQGTATPFCPYKRKSMVSEWIDLRLSFKYEGDCVKFAGKGEMTWGNEDIPAPRTGVNKKYRVKKNLRHYIHFEVRNGKLTRNPETKKIDVEFLKEYKYVRQPEQRFVKEQQRHVTTLYDEAHKDFFKLKYDSRQHPDSLMLYQTRYFGNFKIGLKDWEMEGMYKIYAAKRKKPEIDCGIFSMKAPALLITKAINDIKSWDVNIIIKNRVLANRYSLKSLRVKDSETKEWVRKVKENQSDTAEYQGNTKVTVDGTTVIVTKPLGIEELVLKNEQTNLEISLANCGEITQNPWFDVASPSSWKETEDVANDLWGHDCVGYYSWLYDRPMDDDCKVCNIGGYNTVKIILYRTLKFQYRVELTGSVLPPTWFLALDKSLRRKIEYAAKNDFDKLRVCVENRLGIYPYLTDNCGLETTEKAKRIVEFFNNAENQRDKRPMQWVHWGDTRVIPYIALGSLAESKSFEEEQPFEPDWYTNLNKTRRNKIRHKVERQVQLTERQDNLTRKQIRDITSYYKRKQNHCDASFKAKWWEESDENKKETVISKVFQICREQNQCKTSYQDEKSRQESENLAREKLDGLLREFRASYGSDYVSKEQLNALYEYCNKKVRQMTRKMWFYMEKQMHDAEDWCNRTKDVNKVIRKKFNELNDMGPFPVEVFKTLREWAVFTFGTQIINYGQDDIEEGSIGLQILMFVADSEWELRCIASLFEFARILTPEGLAKVDDSFSKFEIELATEEKLKGRMPTDHNQRGSSLFHRSTRAVFKRASLARYKQNDVELAKAR